MSYLTARLVLRPTFSTLVKISFEKARISLDYLYNHVTEDTAEFRKLSTKTKATFYRNLKKINPTGYNRKKADRGLSIKTIKNQFAKNPF